MTDNTRSSFAKNVARMLFLAALFSALFASCNVASRFPLDDTRLIHTSPLAYSGGWRAEVDGGPVALPEPSRAAASCHDAQLRLENTLPLSLPGSTSLCFQTKNESVRVFVDDALVYSYGDVPQTAYGHGVGAIWNMVQLPDDSGGKTVAVELTPIGERTGLAPYEFLLGSYDSLITYLLRDKVPLLIVCVALFLIGVASLVLWVIGLTRHTDWTSAAFSFALFVLLAAVWTSTDSGLFQFFVHNKGTSYLLFGCSFYLFCTPFALFMAGVVPKHRYLFRLLGVVNAAYALLRILLYVFGVMNFEKGLWILHLMMAAMITITNVVLWLPAIREKKLEQPELCLAVSAFTLISAMSLVSFYLGNKLNVQRNGYASGFYVGILLFVLITIVGILRQSEQMRQRAFKAAFYERRAYTDDLTGMMNVKGFDDKCFLLLREAPLGRCYALVDFDVNFFSQYNASNGLDAGDELLKKVASDVRDFCRPGELCARQEADHFVCLLSGDTLEDIIERVRQADNASRGQLSAQMLLLSYGVVEVRDRTLSLAALRNQAVVAKRTVKGNYENNIAVYDQSLHERQLRELELLSGFEAALKNDEYTIFLQPKIDVVTEKIAGAEALVRRICADGSIMSAGPIIEALERKGFVAALDFYILEQVCIFLGASMAEGRAVCPISSNFSRVHLYDPDFPARVAQIVNKHAIPHELIEVELTETSFLAGKEALRNAVQALHAHGFIVSIDDFGSGYSSLNMLKDVPVDAIKLDREFLADFAQNRRAGLIVEHTIHLAQEMHITSIAEGIETEQQLDFLRCLGCDLVQGYFYSRPLPTSVFTAKYFPVQP